MPVKNYTAVAETSAPSSTPESRTQYPTRTPPPTHYPTPAPISSEQISQAYFHLGDSNTCELPCFLGITPGKTRWEDTKKLFSPYISSTRIGLESKYGQFAAIVLNEKNNDLEIRFQIDHDPSTVYYIEMINETPLHEFLSTLGLPNQVLLESGGVEGMGSSFHLAIGYFKRGVIAYLGGEFQVLDGKATICSDQLNNIQFVVLWNPEDIRFIGDLARLYDSGIESISNTTVKEFYNNYSEENSNFCFTLNY
jgi:hypothetical protein